MSRKILKYIHLKITIGPKNSILLIGTLFFVSLLVSCSNKKNEVSGSLYNFDFEKHYTPSSCLPQGWYLSNLFDSIPCDSALKFLSVGLDSQNKVHGQYSFKIEKREKDEKIIALNYAINKTFRGKKIALTGYIKTQDVSNEAGIFMFFEGDGGQLPSPDHMQKKSLKGTNDWQKISLAIGYNDGETAKIVIGGFVRGTGTIWLDNFAVTIDGVNIADAETVKGVARDYKADADTAFSNNSGIDKIVLDDNKIKWLTRVGVVWGFMKYYHADVSNGQYNMDASLFRLLPSIVTANNNDSVNYEIEKWVDGFGRPEACKQCAEVLKSAKIATQADYSYLFSQDNLPASLIGKLEYIRANVSLNSRHYYYAKVPGAGNPLFKNERAYGSNVYPDAGLRLLALYRYWNYVQYFYPDKHLTGEEWNNILPEFIPQFINAKDALSYQLACLKLIAKIHDSHAEIVGGSEIEKFKGTLMIPLKVEYIESKAVVTGYYSDDLNLRNAVKPGDVITKMDGIAIEELIKKYEPLTPGSNFESQMRDMLSIYGFLFRSNKAKATLTILHNKRLKKVSIPRIDKAECISYMRSHSTDTGYKVIQNEIGYLFPAKLSDSDVTTAKKLFERTKGIIVDLRCYPISNFYLKWIVRYAGSVDKCTCVNDYFPGVFQIGGSKGNGGGSNPYEGKVIVLVNSLTQSWAESQAMDLWSSDKVTVIGSRTAGADGNISLMKLPGGLGTSFSGIGMLYLDGTEIQRTGIRIDKIIAPTIMDIVNGRDRLIDSAIAIIMH